MYTGRGGGRAFILIKNSSRSPLVIRMQELGARVCIQSAERRVGIVDRLDLVNEGIPVAVIRGSHADEEIASVKPTFLESHS